MLGMMIAAAVSAASAQPSAEALRLGRELAGAGTLAHLLPMMEGAQTAELLAEDTKLDAKEQAALKASAHRVFLAGQERLLAAEGASYARLLTVGDLRSVAAFERSAAGRAYRAAIPGMIAQTMQSVGKMDYKADVRAAFCKDSGKLCGAK